MAWGEALDENCLKCSLSAVTQGVCGMCGSHPLIFITGGSRGCG